MLNKLFLISLFISVILIFVFVSDINIEFKFVNKSVSEKVIKWCCYLY